MMTQDISAIDNIIEERDALKKDLANLNKRFHEYVVATQRQAQYLALLEHVHSTVARELDLDVVIRTVVESVADAFGYNQVSAYLVKDDFLVMQHQVGYETFITHVPRGVGVMWRVIETKHPLWLEDVSKDPAFIGAIPDITSEIAVPLFVQNEVVGVLNIESIDHVTLTEVDLHLAIALAEHINNALWRAQLYTQVRENEAKTNALIAALPDIMFRFDAQGNYLDIRPSAIASPYYLVEEMVGKQVYDVLPKDLADLSLAHIQQVLETRQISVYEYRISERGEVRDFEARMVAVSDNEVLALVRDITEQKRLEKQRLELNLQQERVYLMSDFMKNISHDFKTPLTTINTALYLMGKTDDPEKRAQRAATISQQSEHLESLVNGLLTITQLDAGEPFTMQPVALNSIVQNIASIAQHLLLAKKIGLHLNLDESLPTILGNPGRLQDALWKLVENAIYFTPSGGQIMLATQTVLPNGHVMIEVSDNGVGIPEEDLPLVFERLYRADKARATNTGGLGLGLSIAQKIIELHGGTIEASSGVDEGSTFRILLPIS